MLLELRIMLCVVIAILLGGGWNVSTRASGLVCVRIC
ncbi:MAG: hypothetical protein GFH27_549285n197 [Chloroflexi bacterium AL-W]|nr:hypothetical protein [Chloroflexi bacterium AL-N1]NOK65709.1 hypothetical protein [Chloroflexi bacterium AL-N10]NOK74350.1 hypothetical protein [Chloroflexi bacterium AL-N5]NOK80742.1 hypothetical protein [Chloroflexi bacterium AL-W]NOK88608.1 hypothetical protein [Chloroflexi bacterium AL-N15]